MLVLVENCHAKLSSREVSFETNYPKDNIIFSFNDPFANSHIPVVTYIIFLKQIINHEVFPL